MYLWSLGQQDIHPHRFTPAPGSALGLVDQPPRPPAMVASKTMMAGGGKVGRCRRARLNPPSCTPLTTNNTG